MLIMNVIKLSTFLFLSFFPYMAFTQLDFTKRIIIDDTHHVENANDIILLDINNEK